MLPGSPLTPERLVRARQQYRHCVLCEHRCGVDRAGGQRGACGAGCRARVYRHRIEYGEEPELVPSHLFYLSGCNLRCAYCIGEADAFDPARGRLLSAPFFRETVAWGQTREARNVQWVGGEPTIHIPAVLGVLAACRPRVPVVWKSNFYGTRESWDLLDGGIDVYVADFKFGNDACARRIARVENYLAVVTRNLMLVAPRARLMVRHLLMPGHFDCCYRPVVAWMREHLPTVPISVRDGYLPRWKASEYPELAALLDRDAGRRARALAQECGLEVIS